MTMITISTPTMHIGENETQPHIALVPSKKDRILAFAKELDTFWYVQMISGDYPILRKGPDRRSGMVLVEYVRGLDKQGRPVFAQAVVEEGEIAPGTPEDFEDLRMRMNYTLTQLEISIRYDNSGVLLRSLIEIKQTLPEDSEGFWYPKEGNSTIEVPRRLLAHILELTPQQVLTDTIPSERFIDFLSNHWDL